MHPNNLIFTCFGKPRTIVVPIKGIEVLVERRFILQDGRCGGVRREAWGKGQCFLGDCRGRRNMWCIHKVQSNDQDTDPEHPYEGYTHRLPTLHHDPLRKYLITYRHLDTHAINNLREIDLLPREELGEVALHGEGERLEHAPRGRAHFFSNH